MLQQTVTDRLTLFMFPPRAFLAETLFTSLFSSFDAYLGHLLRHLYRTCPRLYKTFESRHVKMSDFLTRSKGEILDSLIESEVDAMLRSSYSKCFEKLAKRFNVEGGLTAFDSWKTFIECSQRRHLITHCDGIINQEYIDNCNRAGYPLDPDAIQGKRLTISDDYLGQSIEIVAEVGLKLGQ